MLININFIKLSFLNLEKREKLQTLLLGIEKFVVIKLFFNS